MASRDNRVVNEEGADALMRQLLGEALMPISPPPDLLTRSVRRLPKTAPRIAALQQAKRARIRTLISLFIACGFVLVALIGMVGVFSGNPSLAFLFGDGSQGISQVLLGLHLLAKPMIRILTLLGWPVMLACMATMLAGGWLWWRLLPAPLYVYAEK